MNEELTAELNRLSQENGKLQKELQRVQRLPHMDKARASAIIMQIAAQLARMSEPAKAKALQKAVDLWSTYTTRIEAELDKLRKENNE